MDWTLVTENLLSPPVLFFALGLAAHLSGSDLEMPGPLARALSIYLLFSIGMHGGAELRASGLAIDELKPLLAGMVASALLPLAAFQILRRKLSVPDAAAVAATYGSISAVTFITACSFLDDRGVAWSGNMVAAMALMESPAILVGVLLFRRFGSGNGTRSAPLWSLVREALVNGPVFLLLGSLAIGLTAGSKGWESVSGFAHEPFKGALCLFLLDMGIQAARRLSSLRAAGPVVLGFAVLAPLVQGSLAIGVAHVLQFERGNALLFAVLCASGSYIAVPAAMRTAVPQANPSLYLPMSLGLTFPLNVGLGIPLFMTIIDHIWGQA